MMRSAFRKDILRTLKNGKKRFFSILIITTLGVTMLTGLRASCVDLRYSADRLYDSQNLFDLSVASTLGLDDGDVEALVGLDGVSQAEGEYSATVYTDIDGSRQEAEVRTIGEKINVPTVMQGSLPKGADEIAIDQSYAEDTGKSVGDRLTLIEKGEDTVLANTEYKITAVVLNPMDLNNKNGNVSFRSAATVDYTFFVPWESVDTEIYTAVYLSVTGAEELLCYSDAYDDRISETEEQIESDIKEQRQRARYDRVKAEAMDSYNEAKTEVEDELSDAEAKLAQARAEIEDGKTKLAEGREEMNAQEAKATREFEKAEKELADGYAALQSGEQELDASERQMEEGEEQLALARQTLEEQESETFLQMENGLAQLEEGLATAQAALAALEKQAELLKNTPGDELDAVLSQIEEMKASITELSAQADKLGQQKAAAEQQFAAAFARLEQKEADLVQGKAALEESRAQLEQSRVQLDAGQRTLKEQEAQAEKQFAEGKQKLQDSELELAEGEEELLSKELEFEENKQKAMDELADAKQEIEDIEMAKWYVQSRDSLGGYANVENDAASIEGLAVFFPIIFFIVAILISLTTITRMVEEDRGLIGTYKALGFKNNEIRRKYVIYAVCACVTGGIVGDLCGFIILPKIIFIFFRTMYLLPAYLLRFDLLSGSMGIAMFTVGVLVAVLIACRAELLHMPAILMRPQAPKKGSRIFLEYIPKIWKKLSFLSKVTARNLFRYKKRLIMTVVGIMGCTGLLVCGFAVKNTVAEMMPLQYEEVYRYDLMAVSLAEDNDQLLSYMDDRENIEEYINLQVENVKIKNAQGKEQSVQMFVVPEDAALDDYIRLIDRDGKDTGLSKNGIFVTHNASDVLAFDEGDTLHIQDLSLNSTEVPITGVVENYLGNVVYVSQEYYEKNFDEFTPNAVLIRLNDNCKDPAAYAKTLGEKEGLISSVSTESLKTDFMKAVSLMNMVVYVIIFLAAGLAFIVLFTLSTTNISERCRELATIKVLGFYDREVHQYVNKETLILTVIGIILGLPVGYGMGICLIKMLKIPGMYFVVNIYPFSFVLSAVIAFIFALIVNLITNRILNAIDPVEALKSIE